MSTQHTIVRRDKTFETIKSAVNQLVDTVRPTFGPASNKVIIDKIPYRMVVDDGVQIARDFELNDPTENAIVKLVRETAIRTNDRVGDGTTGSLILLQAIIGEVARKTRWDGRKIELELRKAVKEVKEQLNAMKKEITTKDELKKVAMISFDNEDVAELISDLYFKLGKDATITIDKSSTMETYVEMADGIKLDHGYISPYMITNPDRMEAVLENPYILLTDYRITEVNDILEIMNKMAKENKRELVIICDNLEQSALATAVVNKIQGKFLVVAVVAPKGDNRTVTLEDMALLTGAKMFTEAKGDKLKSAEISDLGRAKQFICRRTESLIIGPKGDPATIATSITELRAAAENEKNEQFKKEHKRRLSFFTNSFAVIKVGAPTEQEQKALKYKVEDAVNAVKAAYTGGVVPGGGRALAVIETSSPILNEALRYPMAQLYENVGMDMPGLVGFDKAHNVVTGETGPFLEVGVMDPVDALIAGVESAVSIASILLTSTGMIVESAKEVTSGSSMASA